MDTTFREGRWWPRPNILSDTTLTLRHLGLITQLNDRPCSCTARLWWVSPPPRPHRHTRSGGNMGGVVRLRVKSVTWLDLLLESYLKSPSAIRSRSRLSPVNVCVCREAVRGPERRADGTVGDPFTCSVVLNDWKTRAKVLLTVLIILLSWRFYSKSLRRLSRPLISSRFYRWIFTGGNQVNCLGSRAQGAQSMKQQSSGHRSIFAK